MSSSNPAPRPLRGSRLIAFVFAIASVVVIPLALVICFPSLDKPGNGLLPDCHVLAYNEAPTTYLVTFRGEMLFFRTVSNPRQCEVEVALWEALPPLTFLLICGVLGWHFGRWVSRRSTRVRSCIPANHP